MIIDYVNIVKTDTVDPAYDVFWEDISSVVNDAAARPVLVVAEYCEPGSAAELQLNKMLDACKLNREQYNIIMLKEGQMVAWHQLRERLDPKIIFLIGVLPAQLGISAMFGINMPNNFNDRTWLPTYSIDELEKNADVKKQLWVNGMKPVFIDKTTGDF